VSDGLPEHVDLPGVNVVTLRKDSPQELRLARKWYLDQGWVCDGPEKQFETGHWVQVMRAPENW